MYERRAHIVCDVSINGFLFVILRVCLVFISQHSFSVKNAIYTDTVQQNKPKCKRIDSGKNRIDGERTYTHSDTLSQNKNQKHGMSIHR